MSTTSNHLQWGIIGTGRIAHTFAKHLATSQTGRLASVASRTQASADQFAADFSSSSSGTVKAYGCYEALLEDPAVEAIYISTPHPMHVEWVIKAARAGKHLLCEKPLATHASDTDAAIQAATEHNVFLMEAFMYRTHPQIKRAVEIIRNGEIGEIRHITASFAFNAAYNAESRLYRRDLAGGGILDVGCYCTSALRLFAGAALGLPFAEPIRVKALGKIGAESGVDEHAAALLEFPNQIIGYAATGIDGALENSVRIYGTEGHLIIPSPWFGGDTTELHLHSKGESTTIQVIADGPLYSMEIDTVARHIADREAPEMSLADTYGNSRTLDLWRKEIGLLYDDEVLGGSRPPLPPIRKSTEIPANLYTRIPGLDKPVSRMAMGVMLEGGVFPHPHGFRLFDYYRELGGNFFDTAHIYGGNNLSDKLLGDWVAQRGNREEIVILAKGAHTPHCTPEAMAKQLDESLESLQTSYADIYMLHRDNLDVPVEDFIDALNEQVRAGRMKIFGGSNWSLERIEAANRYAASKGLQGFGAVSNQLSLAQWNHPVWPGCYSASDDDFQRWFTETQTPLIAWSSQARGFFVNGSRDHLSDAELVSVWYNDDNFERLARVQKLAKEKGTLPIHIAAAYVLGQPFPTIALIGPRRLWEVKSSFEAFKVQLTPEEMAWLNLKA